MGARSCESDSELADRVRRGSVADFGVLFDRHHGAALRCATRMTGSPVTADDLVSEAFLSTFAALRRGDGPTRSFRAYLLTAVRSAHVDAVRRGARLQCLPDLPDLEGDPSSGSGGAEEPGFDSATVVRAFRSLPEQWQRVLWLTTVEGRSHLEVAELLAVKPVSVRVLAFRAREGLRRAFIQEHLRPASAPECAGVTADLPAFARSSLPRSKVVGVETHLRACRPCRERAAEAQQVGRRIAAALGPRSTPR